MSNFLEYVAGTYAGDATQRFELRLVSKSPAEVAVEFYGIIGKVYTIEASADLSTWTAVPFSLVSGAAGERYHRAAAIGILRGYVPAGAEPSRFYRLTVR